MAWCDRRDDRLWLLSHSIGIQQALCDPGPDLVVCDEGHRIKNDYTNISQALKRIRTRCVCVCVCVCVPVCVPVTPPPLTHSQTSYCDDRVPPTKQPNRVLVYGRLCSTQVPRNQTGVCRSLWEADNKWTMCWQHSYCKYTVFSLMWCLECKECFDLHQLVYLSPLFVNLTPHLSFIYCFNPWHSSILVYVSGCSFDALSFPCTAFSSWGVRFT